MKLYLLRHATAADIASSDAERALTAAGREEARVVGQALAVLGRKVSHILSSPLVRARQTAEIAGTALSFKGSVELIDELRNDVATGALLKSLPRAGDAQGILLVGHMPSLAEHLAALIGAKSADGLPIGKGGIACVELDQLAAGRGQLRWLLRQAQLQKIAAAAGR